MQLRPHNSGARHAFDRADAACRAHAKRRLRLLLPKIMCSVTLALAAGEPVEGQAVRYDPQVLKAMSIEELMNLEVTSVSRRPESISTVAASISVVTGEDARRSTASSLSEALRLAPNLRVAQANSYATVITARGFSQIFSNKLLVMVDGRTVYTPLFAGVLWDAQNILLEDLDHIEVVSGPGGSLWGANAVNGVINVVSRNARDTQGWYAAGALGDFLEHWTALRYGGELNDDLHFRVYGQHFARGHTFLPNGEPASDEWDMTHGGFRLDWRPSPRDEIMVQGEAYDGELATLPTSTPLNGQHLLARWDRELDDDSDLRVQVYYDRIFRRDAPGTLTDRLRTYDLDFQHGFPLGTQHRILWGAGYRLMQSRVLSSTPLVGFLPNRRDMELFSAFIQDEIALQPDRLKLTAGTKLEHNVFSGLEVQPSLRLVFLPNATQTYWGAISRAVRSPSRVDVDSHLPTFPVPPETPSVQGGPNFDSEKVIAYEAGFRTRISPSMSVAVATFYNDYDDLYSVEALPGTQIFQIQNGGAGKSWGAELSGRWRVAQRWQLRAGYNYFRRHLRNKPGHTFDPALVGNDPRHMVMLHSIWDVGRGVEFDVTARYVSELPNPAVPGFVAFDVRLAWQIRQFELSLNAQNLGNHKEPEFGFQDIPSGVFGKVVARW